MQGTRHSDGTGRELRLYIYQHFVDRGRAPKVAEMAAALRARCIQASGELWRAAPFSAVPTPFAVQVGKRQWWGNCIWDALGIPAMLGRDATIDASCGCCNYRMILEVANGKLRAHEGIIHIAVPARHWYDDIAFT